VNETGTQQEHPVVYVAILNWNGWGDTIECLESVFRQTYPNYRIIVCDNGSTDGSVEYIKKWAQGYLNAGRSVQDGLRHLSYPPVRKPIVYTCRYRHGTNSGDQVSISQKRLTILRVEKNLGYAGGYNVALRYACSQNNVHYVWILNNDTLVAPDALSELVRRVRRTPTAGMCGSTLLHFDSPEKVQALGGAQYNRFLGTHTHIGSGQKFPENCDSKEVEQVMSYVVAASMLVSIQFLRRVGLMSEDYFLYFEEIDWAVRAKGTFSLAYAPKSMVYHKIGASTEAGELNEKADYFALRNRLLFTSKRFRWAFPFVWMSFLGVAVNRLRRRQPRRAMAVLKIMFGGWRRLPD
jgi:GT2 family glycosyltransferase